MSTFPNSSRHREILPLPVAITANWQHASVRNEDLNGQHTGLPVEPDSSDLPSASFQSITIHYGILKMHPKAQMRQNEQEDTR